MRRTIALGSFLSLVVAGCFVAGGCGSQSDADRAAPPADGPGSSSPDAATGPTTPGPSDPLDAGAAPDADAATGMLDDGGYPSIPSNFAIQDWLGTAPIPKSAAPDVVGAFRFVCNASHEAYDDPIVYPGQPGKSHLHQFFGNTKADAFSTYASLRTTGESTCANILNRSAYWVPAMMNGKGKVVRPDYVLVYYKRFPTTSSFCTTKGKACADIPRGLRFIFGYDAATPEIPTTGHWTCKGPTATPDEYPDIPTAAKNCPVGNQLGAILEAPACWNGQLDSPDHRAHLSRTVKNNTTGQTACPATHPYVLPAFTLHVWYTVDADLDKSGTWSQSTTTWSLSSDGSPGTMRKPGSTLHADWFGAWDDTILDTWHDHCIDKLLNCSDGDLGNGTKLKLFPGFSFTANPRLVDPP